MLARPSSTVQILNPSSLFHHAYLFRIPRPNFTPPSRTITVRPRRSTHHPSAARLARKPIFQRVRSAHSDSHRLGSKTESISFSQRMRKLSREYGWSALGVYLALSALDFPICFAAVRLLGVERIGHYERVIVDSFRSVFPSSGYPGESDSTELGSDQGGNSESQIAQAHRKSRGEEASIWTQLALAYAVHKSFIFIRVPLTAAVTPKVVKVLRSWGWSIGKRSPKAT